jgi:prophage regulatory protein
MAAPNQATIDLRVPLRVLRRKQVQDRVALSRSSIYDGVNAGTFPKPINLGPHSVAWIEAEIEQWLLDRVAKRDASAK